MTAALGKARGGSFESRGNRLVRPLGGRCQVPSATVGVLFAGVIEQRGFSLIGLTALGGATLVAIFVALRLAGLGDYHQPGPGAIGFLTVTKYPPSLAFFSITLGLDLLLLAILSRVARSSLVAPLAVFGRAPLFFYLLHLYLLAAVSWGFREGTTFAVMYGVWAAAIVAMYPLCRRYAAFKAAKPPTSWWRLL